MLLFFLTASLVSDRSCVASVFLAVKKVFQEFLRITDEIEVLTTNK